MCGGQGGGQFVCVRVHVFSGGLVCGVCPQHCGYKPPDEGPNEYQTIPLSKIEDFGVHAKQVCGCCCSKTHGVSVLCVWWGFGVWSVAIVVTI